MTSSDSTNRNEVPTLLLKDSKGSDLLCFMEQMVPISGVDYALLTPVDTPVSLFKLVENNDPELIETIKSNEPILEVADVVLQEHDLRLIRSAVTLTVPGELEEPEPEELEDDEPVDDFCKIMSRQSDLFSVGLEFNRIGYKGLEMILKAL